MKKLIKNLLFTFSPIMLLTLWSHGLHPYAACFLIFPVFFMVQPVVLEEKRPGSTLIASIFMITGSAFIFLFDGLAKGGQLQPNITIDVRRIGETKVAMSIMGYMIVMALLCLRLQDKKTS